MQDGLTCAIIYGTTIKTEKAILERLRNVRHEAAHPLLIPGILAEMELLRHTGLVDSMINEVEAKVLELDMQTSKPRHHRQIDVERRNQSKRETWLNLSYLRNSIMTWKIQLLRIIEHADLLNTSPAALANAPRNVSHDLYCVKAAYGREYIQLGYPTHNRTSLEIPLFDRRPNELNVANTHGPRHSWSHTQDFESFGMNKTYIEYPLQLHEHKDGSNWNDHVREVGERIKVRLSAIIDDYNEKIRDCNMRVDGMAMATQWVYIHTILISISN